MTTRVGQRRTHFSPAVVRTPATYTGPFTSVPRLPFRTFPGTSHDERRVRTSLPSGSHEKVGLLPSSSSVSLRSFHSLTGGRGGGGPPSLSHYKVFVMQCTKVPLFHKSFATTSSWTGPLGRRTGGGPVRRRTSLAEVPGGRAERVLCPWSFASTEINHIYLRL